MRLFIEVSVIFALINISLAYKHIDSTKNTIIYKWGPHIGKDLSRNAHAEATPIFDLFAGEDRHSLAVLKCENFSSTHPDKCNITIQTHTFDDAIHQSICTVELPSKQRIRRTSVDQIKFLKKDKVVIGWKEEHEIYSWRMNYQVISTETCKRSHFIHVRTANEESTKNHPILAHDNYFDIVFHDKLTCHTHHYCTLSYNYDGELIDNEPQLFTTTFYQESEKFIPNGVYVMKGYYEDASVLVAQKAESEIEHVYSPVMGQIEIAGAFYKQHSYTNSSGYATLCWSSRNKQTELACIWVDGTHGNDTMRLSFTKPFSQIPFVYNNENGQVLLVRARGDDNDKYHHVVIDEGHMNGRCKRLVDAEIQDIPFKFQLTIVDHDTYCFSYIGNTKQDPNSKNKLSLVRYTFQTRCVKEQEKEKQKFFDCGSDRYYV